MAKQSEALTSPVLTEAEAGMLAAILTAHTETPDNVAEATEAGASLVNVASARDALSAAQGKAFTVLGMPRYGMAVAVYAATEAGATREAIGDAAGINRSIVGHYSRFPDRLASMADALGMPRVAITKDSATIEVTWSIGSRLSADKWQALLDTVAGIAAITPPADADSPDAWEYVSDAASMLSLARGSRKAEAGTEAEAEGTEAGTEAGGVIATEREAQLLAAIALVATVHGDSEATDAEREAIAGLLATLSA